MNDFTYTVERINPKLYKITKWGDNPEPEDQYGVSIPNPKSDEGIFCACLGFRRQKYPHHEHKHIRLIRLFIAQDEPVGRVYSITGAYPNIAIVVVRESLYTADKLEFDPSD